MSDKGATASTATTAGSPDYKANCPYPWTLPKPPEFRELTPCPPPPPCTCPAAPPDPESGCLDELIECQNKIVKKADRAKAFVEELTAIQGKVASAQVDYTQTRFVELRDIWAKQDKDIVELIRNLVCAVPCWKCLLWCRLCAQLASIRAMEDQLNGKGILTDKVYSLYDLEAWHKRNVANMKVRVERIKGVLKAWEEPSKTLGEALDKNGKLIEDTQKIIGSDPAKALYDVFMTLIPRHWTIRPRDLGENSKWKTGILDEYITICECDETQPKTGDKSQQKQEQKEKCDDGTQPPPPPPVPPCRCDNGNPEICCGPDVGIPSLRQRLIGPHPYIVDPNEFPGIICCLTSARLSNASEHLATAEADLDAATKEIERITKRITEKTEALEASFKADLTDPCRDYRKENKPSPTPKPTEEGYGGAKQTDQTTR